MAVLLEMNATETDLRIVKSVPLWKKETPIAALYIKFIVKILYLKYSHSVKRGKPFL